MRIVNDPLDRLSELLRSQRGALLAVARDEGLDAEEALECVQDALCTFLARPLDQDEGHAVASLKTIIRNAARNFRRRHRRLMPHVPVEPAAEPPGTSPGVDDLLAHAEDVVRLRACVAELCNVQRAVITLRLLDERSGEDVAAAVGVSRSHVDVLVHRAKAALRVCMAPHRR